MNNSITLLITSGDGPIECRRAVTHILHRMTSEAEDAGIDIDIAKSSAKKDPKSAILRLHSKSTSKLANKWVGTIQWKCKSSFRKNHKRQNWFVGIFKVPNTDTKLQLDISKVKFETFRAGGPGGQHQNTTDSAVRATCQTTGLSVVVRDGRSQHRNKSIAIERLQTLLQSHEALNQSQHKKQVDHFHHQLERGNPIRRFKGDAFKEVK